MTLAPIRTSLYHVSTLMTRSRSRGTLWNKTRDGRLVRHHHSFNRCYVEAALARTRTERKSATSARGFHAAEIVVCLVVCLGQGDWQACGVRQDPPPVGSDAGAASSRDASASPTVARIGWRFGVSFFFPSHWETDGRPGRSPLG